MIRVSCDLCGTPYQLSDDKSGKNIRCRECDAIVNIPRLAGQIDDSCSDDDYEPPRQRLRRHRSTRRKSGRNPALIIGATLGSLFLVADLSAGIYFLVKSPAKDETTADKKLASGGSKSKNNEVKSPTSSAVQQHDQVMKDLNVQMKEMASAFESIHDIQSARAAATRIDRVCDVVNKIADRASGLPEISPKENEQLKIKYGPSVRETARRMDRVKPVVQRWSL